MTRLCEICGERPALFRRQGYKLWRADKQHTLCRQCFRTQMEALNVNKLVAQQRPRSDQLGFIKRAVI